MPSLLYGQAEAGRLGRPHRPVRAPLRPAQVRPVAVTPALPPERRAALRAAKLGALARQHFGIDPDTAERLPFPGGAALVAADRGFVLADEEPQRSLGRALAWWRRVANPTGELHLLAEQETGLLARRAAFFGTPPSVWQVDGRSVRPATAQPRSRRPPMPSDAELALADRLRAAGADVVVDGGVVTGEVLGLEIARITAGDDGPRLEIGVGRRDREAFALLHGEVLPERALAEVVASVHRFRRSAGPDHPFRRLAQERWLREIVVARPHLVGADTLDRIDGPAAAGTDTGGQEVVVVCSVGIDIDLVPSGADARDAHDPGARLVLVVPERDDYAVTRELASALRREAEVVTVPDDWRALA